MSVQHIWNLFQLLGPFTGRKLANLSWNFVTERCKQRPETTMRRLCCEKLGTSHDVKGVHFWSIFLLKEQMMTSVRKTLKTLVWSAQKRLISSEICLENIHKIGQFLAIAFWWSLPQKLLRNFCEIGWFFRKFFPKNPAKFDFTFHEQSEDLLYRDLLYQGSTDAEVLLNIHCISWLLPKSSYSKYGLPQLVMKN